MELNTRSVVSPKMRPHETLLWCGRPSPAFRFSAADMVNLIPIVLFAIFFFPFASVAGSSTAIWVCVPIFFIILLLSLKTFGRKMRDKREAHYAITSERILIVRVNTNGDIRDMQSKGLRQITNTKMSFNKEGIGTIVFLSGHSTHMYRNNPIVFYDIDDCENVMEIYRRQNRDAEQGTTVSTKASILKPLIFLSFFALIVFFVFSLASPSKTPATVEQVQTLLVSLGYEPQDITEQYASQAQYITQCIGTQKNDIHFYFYTLSDKNAARSVFFSFTADIFSDNARGIETGKQTLTYCVLQFKTKTKYSAAASVGTTAMYAYCDAENSAKINEILTALDYLT